MLVNFIQLLKFPSPGIHTLSHGTQTAVWVERWTGIDQMTTSELISDSSCEGFCVSHPLPTFPLVSDCLHLYRSCLSRGNMPYHVGRTMGVSCLMLCSCRDGGPSMSRLRSMISTTKLGDNNVVSVLPGDSRRGKLELKCQERTAVRQRRGPGSFHLSMPSSLVKSL